MGFYVKLCNSHFNVEPRTFEISQLYKNWGWNASAFYFLAFDVHIIGVQFLFTNYLQHLQVRITICLKCSFQLSCPFCLFHAGCLNVSVLCRQYFWSQTRTSRKRRCIIQKGKWICFYVRVWFLSFSAAFRWIQSIRIFQRQFPAVLASFEFGLLAYCVAACAAVVHFHKVIENLLLIPMIGIFWFLLRKHLQRLRYSFIPRYLKSGK